MKPFKHLFITGFGLLLAAGIIFLAAAWRGPSDAAASAAGSAVLYMPFISNLPEAVELADFHFEDAAGKPQAAFLAAETLDYVFSGENAYVIPITVTVQITESGPCGRGLVYSETLILQPGNWVQRTASTAPDCPGEVDSALTVFHPSVTPTLHAPSVVVEPIVTSYTNEQGFDRCAPASVPQMQTWWDLSPYYVVNLYIGGIHYACNNDLMDAFWVQDVAEQGWQFTAIWVGPQAPCTNYNHKISSNIATAYSEGIAEAIAASDRARELGLIGDLVLLYDVEGYSGASTACRNAVASFIQGWTDQLHQLGYLAGAYGSACSSYLADWHNNSPIPDQVWIAHWVETGYDPNANVWNVPCGVSNAMWANQQRIKQYGAPHTETWGGVSMNVDSNVFDTLVLESPSAPAPAVSDFAPLGPASGWVLADGHLFRTDDAGLSWRDVSPQGLALIGAVFLDDQVGFAAARTGDTGEIRIARTSDGGLSWSVDAYVFPETLPSPAAFAYFEALDAEHLWLSLRLESGASFSLGRLLASSDGGKTWAVRDLPIGAPVHFSDPAHGWILGGPNGNDFFTTADGGGSWTAAAPPNDIGYAQEVDLPDGAVDAQAAGPVVWAVSLAGDCSGFKAGCAQKQTLWISTDGGATWQSAAGPFNPH